MFFVSYMNMKQFVCLSGLPRSGSTILSAILNQNPLIHAEGNSAVCQFIWDLHQSGTVNAAEQLNGNNRTGTLQDIIQQIPNIYYKDRPSGKEIIVDKCRAWTNPANVALLRQYLDPAIKIIVLERSITAIMQSFMKLFQKNNWSKAYRYAILQALLVPHTEPVMLPLLGMQMARKENKTFLFIHYDDLIAKPAETMERIYAFCGWEPFAHHFENIVNAHPENDAFYNLKDFHTIRATLNKEANTVILPPDILAKCQEIDMGGNPPEPPKRMHSVDAFYVDM